MTNKTGTIYTLSDPRDGAVRYVGKTTKTLLDRLGGHLASPTNPAMRVWINALGGQGLTPHIEPVTTVPEDKLADEEGRQIRRHAKQGHRLLNSPYYHRNLADLIPTPPGATAVEPKAPKARSPKQTKTDAYLHKLYGGIAATRAAGKITRGTAALHSLLLAPVAAVAMVVIPASSSRICRCLTVAAVGTFYAWDIGFDHLIRDFAHLPTAEIAAFWSEYLAAPVQTLAWHAACGLFLAGWLAYVQVAAAAGAAHRTAQRPRRKASPSGADLVAAQAANALEAAVVAGAVPGSRKPRSSPERPSR